MHYIDFFEWLGDEWAYSYSEKEREESIARIKAQHLTDKGRNNETGALTVLVLCDTTCHAAPRKFSSHAL